MSLGAKGLRTTLNQSASSIANGGTSSEVITLLYQYEFRGGNLALLYQSAFGADNVVLLMKCHVQVVVVLGGDNLALL